MYIHLNSEWAYYNKTSNTTESYNRTDFKYWLSPNNLKFQMNWDVECFQIYSYLVSGIEGEVYCRLKKCQISGFQQT